MIGYLVDTNVISEYAKANPSSRVIRWLELIDPKNLYASVVSFGEIRLGIEGLPIGKRRTELESWLETGLPDWFADNLLPVTKLIAEQWAVLTNLTLVTRSVKDFTDLGLTILNPWDSQPESTKP